MIYTNVCGFIILLTTIVYCEKFLFKALKATKYEGKIQYSGAVGITSEKSRLFCYLGCIRNLKCLTFFYNDISQKCVLHSKAFHFPDPDQTEQGWIAYLLIDTRSRCHYNNYSGFLLYRELNVCHNFNTALQMNYNGLMEPTCLSYGGALVKIDTHEKQTYFSHALEGRTIERVAIQGRTNVNGVWIYDDGTPLVYTNWMPSYPQPGTWWYLQIYTNDEWTDQINIRTEFPCLFICEIV